jgi:hypothetical protein
LVISSSSEADLITTPLFFVAEPDAQTGFISIANEAGVDLKPGNLSKNIPAILVAFLSQSFPSSKRRASLSSAGVILQTRILNYILKIYNHTFMIRKQCGLIKIRFLEALPI